MRLTPSTAAHPAPRSLPFTRRDTFATSLESRNSFPRADSDDKVRAVVGNAADDAVAMGNFLRLVRGKEAGFEVCSAIGLLYACVALSQLARDTSKNLTMRSPMSSAQVN
jgi:hypothetical protein